MKIVERQITDLIAAEYNPRTLSQTQHQQLTDSLKRFGFVDPVIVNTHETRANIVVGGHQRLRVWADLGHATVPTVEVELDRDRERELNVRLNRNTGSWDWDALANEFEMAELTEWGFSEEELTGAAFGDDELGSDGASKDETYTGKIKAPIYEPKGDCPKVADLADKSKTAALVADIDAAGLPPDISEFLRAAATRHTKFHFARIAEFYCHASPDVQSLMEQSGLVIIDMDKAIEYGFVHMTERLAELCDSEMEDANDGDA